MLIGSVVSFLGGMWSLRKLVELGYDFDSLSVSSCTGSIGGLLRSFFNFDADVVSTLGCAIVIFFSITNFFGSISLDSLLSLVSMK
jgi:hypothetical protein